MTGPADGPFEPVRGNGFRVEVVMGMPIGIDLRDAWIGRSPSRADELLDQSFDLLRRADQTFSLWRDDTPMARLSAGRAELHQMPLDVVEVLRECVHAARQTSGWFSARDPHGRVDPTGLVKGWAVAKVGTLLTAAGCHHWCISAAGDIAVSGRAMADEPWIVGIADPDSPGGLVDAVQLGSGGAIATSGTAERGGHIWDPSLGEPARGVRSVSVVSAQGGPGDILRAEVLATAAAARGRRAIDWLDQLAGVDALVIDDEGRRECTTGWMSRSVGRGAA